MSDGIFVAHAKRELAMINEDPEFVAAYLKIAEVFDGMGHSGGSCDVAVEVVNQLLKLQNLTPLTNNPDEWQYHDERMWGEIGGIWQNKRFGEAFSKDGGKTYYLLSEGGRRHGPKMFHRSKPHIRKVGP